MSIPLDRHYHYLENLCGDDIIIYHWYPHGSKKLENLTMFKDYTKRSKVELNLSLVAFFHDQEPLSTEYYSNDEIVSKQEEYISSHHFRSLEPFRNLSRSMPPLRVASVNPYTVYDKLILVHSEKNSSELQKFEDNGFIGVYYWSHAIIAQDWFRYAEHDFTLKSNSNFKFDFLIYNRAWAGTREYRLKFAELLVESNLVSHCKTSFAATDDSGVNYAQHTFHNNDFALTNFDLENKFVKNTTTSCFSADYDATDYKQCGLEVVLETLFDDQRNHLTEKSLRPIACNKPFILAATPFSLKYLRSYGFKTFDSLIDETYDTIIDPKQRLEAIVQELKRISCLSDNSKQELWEKLNVITEHNQQLFFSKEWQNSITDELKTNLDRAIAIAAKHRTGKYLRKLYSHPLLDQEVYQTDAKKILDKWLEDNRNSY